MVDRNLMKPRARIRLCKDVPFKDHLWFYALSLFLSDLVQSLCNLFPDQTDLRMLETILYFLQIGEK